jgi:phospholipase C
MSDLTNSQQGQAAAPAVGACPINHVFVLMLENRSFDHMFAYSGIPGIRAATPACTNVSQGTSYASAPGAPEKMPTDPGHEFLDVLEQLCGPGQMISNGYPTINSSGFAASYATSTTEGPAPQTQDIGKIMLGVDTRTQAPALYQLATQFALCDNWFASLPGPTWPNRYFAHGASSAGLDDSPTKEEIAEWESVHGFAYPNGSIYDALGSDNYRLYQDEFCPQLGRIPQVASIKGISFLDVNNLSYLQADLQDNYTCRYTFIDPAYGDMVSNTYEGGSSQHPMDGIAAGDQLVARVYNMIRNSPVWQSSLLIIAYDEHGGFYDSVSPGKATPPGDGGKLGTHGFDFSQYGVRVPALVISPWVGQGVIDHTLYNHASILATLERLFNMEPLTERDKAANHLLGLITNNCRTDCPQGI